MFKKAMLSDVFKVIRGLLQDQRDIGYACADGDPASHGASDLCLGGKEQRRRARLCDDPSYSHALKR